MTERFKDACSKRGRRAPELRLLVGAQKQRASHKKTYLPVAESFDACQVVSDAEDTVWLRPEKLVIVQPHLLKGFQLVLVDTVLGPLQSSAASRG